ncbi:MAG: retron system putative HNH endonuclease [Brevinema sp.]
MKYIQKISHCDSSVKTFEKLNGNWDSFHKTNHQIYLKLVQILKHEQNSKCGYCESLLKDGSQHIEHIKPQSSFPDDIFKYDNIILSCGPKYSNQEENNNPHCGNTKEKSYNNNFISPLSVDCSEYFSYQYDGIISNNDNKDPYKGTATIDILKLNAPSLKAKRKKVYQYIIEPIITDYKISEEDKNTRIKEEIDRISQDRMLEYETFLLHVLRSLLPNP